MAKVQDLIKGKYQPRYDFVPNDLNELADSISSQGIIQPIVVRRLGHNRYEIIAGERRWRAAQLAKLKLVPCIVRELSDENAALLAIIENVQRQDLNPLEEAACYQRISDEFGYDDAEIAIRTGKSRSAISHSRRLLTLEKTVQQAIRRDDLQVGHGKVLASLEHAQQRYLSVQAINLRWSVRQLETAIKNLQNPNKKIVAPKTPDVQLIERRLTEFLGSKVVIENQQDKWRLTVSCLNLDIFEGILQKIGFK